MRTRYVARVRIKAIQELLERVKDRVTTNNPMEA
jgi:hypothetical protein